MSNLRSARKKLDPDRVWIAERTRLEKLRIAKQVIVERAKKDAAFAAEVMKAVGDMLPKEIKEACEMSVASLSITDADKRAEELWKPTSDEIATGLPTSIVPCDMSVKNIVSGDETYKLTKVVQMDGGGERLVNPNEEIMDSPNSGIDFTAKT